MIVQRKTGDIMARKKKDGMRATGIYSRNGRLYCIVSYITIKDGERTYATKWEKTELTDTPENIRKASKMREILQTRICGVHTIDKDASISQFIDIFLERKRHEIAASTFRPYNDKCNRIKKYFADTKVRDIKKEHVVIFLESLFHAGLQPKYVKDIKNLFRATMDLAVNEGIILSNPVIDAKAAKSIVDAHNVIKRDDDYLSEDEQKLFLHLSNDHPLHDLFFAALYFGFRREEVLGLRWRSIDFKRRILRVDHTVVKGNNEVIRKDAGKTASSIRELPFDDKIYDFFQGLKKKELANRELFGNKYVDPELDYVFRHMDGELYYPDYPSQAFHDFIKAHPELPQHVKFHSLRKSCASNLIRAGVEPKAVQLWMGHKDIATTMKYYYRIKDEDAKKAASDALKLIFN